MMGYQVREARHTMGGHVSRLRVLNDKPRPRGGRLPHDGGGLGV